MIYALRMAQRQSLSKGARAIISRLMMNAIRTGAITAVVAGVGLVLLLLSVDYSQTIALVLGPLFPNVCLANLNSRARIRRLGDDPQFSTVHAGERNPGSGRATTLRFARPPSISAQSGATGLE
ncbi:hypothetical protein BD779DRAFT_643332 [Infundibulicybe gibba]|nr:hypothetical protein BD779DRAFT_643332 [Infundibulicybe gibba]